MYRLLIRPILFLINPEKVHYLVFDLLGFQSNFPGFNRFLSSLYIYRAKSLERNILGLNFPNPVGLAAGLDKDGKRIDELACFGAKILHPQTIQPARRKGIAVRLK